MLPMYTNVKRNKKLQCAKENSRESITEMEKKNRDQSKNDPPV